MSQVAEVENQAEALRRSSNEVAAAASQQGCEATMSEAGDAFPTSGESSGLEEFNNSDLTEPDDSDDSGNAESEADKDAAFEKEAESEAQDKDCTTRRFYTAHAEDFDQAGDWGEEDAQPLDDDQVRKARAQGSSVGSALNNSGCDQLMLRYSLSLNLDHIAGFILLQSHHSLRSSHHSMNSARGLETPRNTFATSAFLFSQLLFLECVPHNVCRSLISIVSSHCSQPGI
jgi:hypothetical protein